VIWFLYRNNTPFRGRYEVAMRVECDHVTSPFLVLQTLKIAYKFQI